MGPGGRVGRAGGLALALGVGAAVATGLACGAASADETSAASAGKSVSISQNARPQAAGPRRLHQQAKTSIGAAQDSAAASHTVDRLDSGPRTSRPALTQATASRSATGTTVRALPSREQSTTGDHRSHGPIPMPVAPEPSEPVVVNCRGRTGSALTYRHGSQGHGRGNRPAVDLERDVVPTWRHDLWDSTARSRRLVAAGSLPQLNGTYPSVRQSPVPNRRCPGAAQRANRVVVARRPSRALGSRLA